MPAHRILIVDDDEDLRLLCELCLQAHGGFEVLCAASGEEAVALSACEPLDLVLLDVCMPGMDGISTLARLRSQGRNAEVPVLLMTAAGEGALDGQAGWSGVIAKPFDVRRLGAELADFLARGGSHGEPR